MYRIAVRMVQGSLSVNILQPRGMFVMCDEPTAHVLVLCARFLSDLLSSLCPRIRPGPASHSVVMSLVVSWL